MELQKNNIGSLIVKPILFKDPIDTNHGNEKILPRKQSRNKSCRRNKTQKAKNEQKENKILKSEWLLTSSGEITCEDEFVGDDSTKGK